VVGCADDVTGQAVHAFVCMKPEYDSKSTDDPELAKELTLQVRKVIGPFAAPKKIVSLVSFLGCLPYVLSASPNMMAVLPNILFP
jgi:acyl-coenzyme A synthetase/AMP-(fatty) acid ligase